MKKVLIVFSAVMLLSSFGVAFADGDAANLFKTHCQGCHGADGGRVPASGIEPIKGQSAADLLVKQLSDEQLKSLADYASTL